MVISMYKLSMSFDMDRTVEKTYISVTLEDMLKEFNLAKGLDDIESVHLWRETAGEQTETVLMKTWHNTNHEVKPRPQEESTEVECLDEPVLTDN